MLIYQDDIRIAFSLFPARFTSYPTSSVRLTAGKAEVYLDGGARTGTDVLKALALGARCVFIGRPALWGLAHNGAEGVQQVLQILTDELSLAMARTGCAKISDIQPSLVVHQSYYGIPAAKTVPMSRY
ncbi:HAO2 [Branchiostoma lanceolatum]|uniref:HAO2 protein n=1 Tax=Branchiostoma lanceolatum TaxID=7740 RepID=A0A8K0ECS3_BRALA|nr:HAO2 [Branchiostoma lanceolatum]